MSIDIEIIIGEEELQFPFNGLDTEIITKGIVEWKGYATPLFLENFRKWVDSACPDWFKEKAERVFHLAKVNNTYVKWKKS